LVSSAAKARFAAQSPRGKAIRSLFVKSEHRQSDETWERVRIPRWWEKKGNGSVGGGSTRGEGEGSVVYSIELIEECRVELRHNGTEC